jgi:uncharacterized protein (DUF1697 family)
MPSSVALLRGINVGGNNLIRMPDLVECFRDAGYGDVRTYVQSGNVLFAPDHAGGPELEDALERMLEERFNIPADDRAQLAHDHAHIRDARARGLQQRHCTRCPVRWQSDSQRAAAASPWL